jgi:hypothetical protein
MMRDNPAVAAAALKTNVPETDVAVAEQGIRATLPLKFNENTERDGFGIFSPAMLAKTWDWVAKQQGLPAEKINPMSAIASSFATNEEERSERPATVRRRTPHAYLSASGHAHKHPDRQLEPEFLRQPACHR